MTLLILHECKQQQQQQLKHKYAVLTPTEQPLKLGKGIIALDLPAPTSAGVVILMSIVQALLFASVRTWLGLIICMQVRDTVTRAKNGKSRQRNMQ